MKYSVTRISIGIMLFIFLNGCSAFMAVNQPGKKPVEMFKVGTPRSMLVAEFGLPTGSEERDDKKYETFKFTQGYSSIARAGRAVFHVLAFGISGGGWEIMGVPGEVAFAGTKMAYEVSYDKDDRIDSVTLLKKK